MTAVTVTDVTIHTTATTTSVDDDESPDFESLNVPDPISNG